MASVMRSYTCFLTGQDGRLAEVLFADCIDDDDAVRWAEKALIRNPEIREAEVWDRDRLVRRSQRT